MTIVETRASVWEALADRAPGVPSGPADPGLWRAVAERVDPIRARPALRAGVEDAHVVNARGISYVMLRSPNVPSEVDGPGYVRLTPDEWRLAQLFDGTRTLARLFAEFARISGRLAPDQVARVVADLAANRMLCDLPLDAYRALRPGASWPVRARRGLVAVARGRRIAAIPIDPLISVLYKAGGRLLFTRAGAALGAVLALAGLGLFVLTWTRGEQSLFLTGDSYVVGALVLLGLNLVALAGHELGHALGAKHSGRRVPAGGLFLHYGLPSVFVDTSDVWMASRRARILTTLAGPAAGLVLAGAAQVVALAYPPAAPWAFKLAFLWYLQTLINSSPLLPLDGSHLLADWLEVPHLRAKAGALVRARPPLRRLDREGRLVALYAVLAVAWLVVAAGLVVRVYTDRVAGLVTGLWRSGWPARLVMVAVIAGLLSPLLYEAGGWTALAIRRIRARVRDRRDVSDVHRRLDALRHSVLGRLSPASLDDLAAQAGWLRPRTGEHLISAGEAHPHVYLVVDGALEGRRHGDPSGTVRDRVRTGGVVGLATALSGAPSTLDWSTAGTALLAVPGAAVAAAVGPLHGPPPAERAELVELLADTPGLAELSEEDRLALPPHAWPAVYDPGDPVTLGRPLDAVVVASGVVVVDNGIELHRGALLGPHGHGEPVVAATARTQARTWTLPAVSGLTLLLRAPVQPSGVRTAAPAFGTHPTGEYPPLLAPPGPPPPVDDAPDRRFERGLWWLVLVLLVAGLITVGGGFWPGPAWAEMPTDRALLTGMQGATMASVGGERVQVGPHERVYVEPGDRVAVATGASAWLTFRGGARTVLCAGAGVSLDALRSGEPRLSAALTLTGGRVLVDTRPASAAFAPVAVTLATGAGTVVADGPARYVAEPAATSASVGAVRLDGVPLDPTGAALTCGGGVALPARGVDEPSTSPSPTPQPAPSASVTPSASPSSPSTSASPSRSPSKTPSTPPPDRAAPRILTTNVDSAVIFAVSCPPGPAKTAGLTATVDGVDDRAQALRVRADYQFRRGDRTGSVTLTWTGSGNSFRGTLGPFDSDRNDRIEITFFAVDDAGNATGPAGGTGVMYRDCNREDDD